MVGEVVGGKFRRHRGSGEIVRVSVALEMIVEALKSPKSPIFWCTLAIYTPDTASVLRKL